jgi:hypothetical protein
MRSERETAETWSAKTMSKSEPVSSRAGFVRYICSVLLSSAVLCAASAGPQTIDPPRLKLYESGRDGTAYGQMLKPRLAVIETRLKTLELQMPARGRNLGLPLLRRAIHDTSGRI